MARFSFLHAADLHLDSPLRGLERYPGAPVELIRSATRQAFTKLVDLAIATRVRFVLIAGDLYDGDWPDYNTGLFFSAGMSRLGEHGINVVLVRGNHDAANRMTKSLTLPAHVRELSTQAPDQVRFDDVGVLVHGMGFERRQCLDNLAQRYPTAQPGWFNLGLLHTSATGSQDHEVYAPCALTDLLAKGYQYWALGHVHKQQFLNQDPYVVYPGNLQGRHIRETGPKGCTLVTVEDGRVAEEPRAISLEVLRWERCRIDVSTAQSPHDVVEEAARGVLDTYAQCEGQPLAVRVELSGQTPANRALRQDEPRWISEIRQAGLAQTQRRVWVEKVIINTLGPTTGEHALNQAEAMGDLAQYLAMLRRDPARARPLLDSVMNPLIKKLMHDLSDEDRSVAQLPDDLDRLWEDVEQLLVLQLSEAEEHA